MTPNQRLRKAANELTLPWQSPEDIERITRRIQTIMQKHASASYWEGYWEGRKGKLSREEEKLLDQDSNCQFTPETSDNNV